MAIPIASAADACAARFTEGRLTTQSANPEALIATATDIGYVTPRDAGHARAIVAQIRAAADAVGRAHEPVHVFADLVVFLGTSVEEAADRKARMDELLAEEWHRR